VICAGSLGKFGEEPREIRVRLDAIGAGRFNQRVQPGARGGAGGGLTEQPIPPSDHKWPYCILNPVGIERDLRMFEERPKLTPLAQHVEQGFTQRTLRQYGVGHLIEPGLSSRTTGVDCDWRTWSRSSAEETLISRSMRYGWPIRSRAMFDCPSR